MTSTKHVHTARRRRTFLEAIPDPTQNWGWSQLFLWLFIGALLGSAFVAQTTSFEYDFSHIFDRFSVPECDPATANCE